MVAPSNTALKDFIRVICESCQQDADSGCAICKGCKFYFWDPETLLCYGADRKPIIAENDEGEMVGVVRQATNPARGLDLVTMLRFIELWVAESAVRKWKLWVDGGWNCSVWPDRYKDKPQTFTSDDPERCVADCYKFIMTIIANPAEPVDELK